MLAYLALTLAYLGYIDQARSRMDEALSEARRLETRPYAGSRALFWRIWSTGSPARLWCTLEEFLALSTEHGFPFYLGWALAFRGRSLIALGQAAGRPRAAHAGAGGIACYRRRCQYADAVHLARRGPRHARAAQLKNANCLAEAARIVETTDERVYEAELLHRVPGDLLNAAGDRSGAERHYRQAIAVAERQSAKLFQLRASTSLARLWRDQGKRAEARDLLGPIYNWFTEGFDAPDLKDAKALLDELTP